MKVIALISGGKDSLFSILHCLANGHEIVALANLHPAATCVDQEDLDSFMYQTVGHSVIPLYAEALDLPLYRQEILGTAVNTDKNYAPVLVAPTDLSPGVQDETESLVPLLQKVLAEHPRANAISTGAILSNYQRTRVESVALRLGLTPLSYLWQYPFLPPYRQSSLLEDMAAVGQDARIIKVASGGLDSSFLWQNVANMKTIERLKRAMGRFGGGDGAVLGEGGEFETLALDGPLPLWRMSIEAELVGEALGDGGSAIMRLGEAKAVEKYGAGNQDEGIRSLRIPDLLDLEFTELLQHLSASTFTMASTGGSLASSPFSIDSLSCNITQRGDILRISNIISPSTRTSASEQVSSVLDQLSSLLSPYSADASAIVSSTLLLRSMYDFITINPIYGGFFTKPNPPARVTVACGDALPDGVQVMLCVDVDLSRRSRKALHVQSRSYWAPANIGPYSQAVAVPVLPSSEAPSAEVVHIAGQIPLVPASMEMVQPEMLEALNLSVLAPLESIEKERRSFLAQTAFSLQHLWRIGRAMSVCSFAGAVAFISACDAQVAAGRAAVAINAWQGIHDILAKSEDAADSDEEELDVWDLKHGVAGLRSAAPGEEADSRPLLPDPSRVEGSMRSPPCFVVQVEELPRGSLIEWSSLGLAGSDVHYGSLESQIGVRIHVTDVRSTGLSVEWAALQSADQVFEVDKLVGDGPEGSALYTAYTAGPLPKEWLKVSQAQVIPCKRVWDNAGNEVAAVIMIKRFAA